MTIRSVLGVLTVATIIATCSADRLSAQTSAPEEVAMRYTDAMRAGNWIAMAELMHPDALSELRTLFDPMFALPNAEGAIPMLLGVATMEEARALSDTGLFAGFMQFMVNQDPNVADALRTATVETIGHVAEGDDAHVVFRMTMMVQGVEVTQLDVISLRRIGDSWRGLLAGDLAAVAQAIRGQLSPPPDLR